MASIVKKNVLIDIKPINFKNCQSTIFLNSKFHMIDMI
jgi:hypothetical protein